MRSNWVEGLARSKPLVKRRDKKPKAEVARVCEGDWAGELLWKAETEGPGVSPPAFPSPYPNGLMIESRLNNNGAVAAIVFPDKNNIVLSTREVWTYSAAGVATKVEGLTGLQDLSFNDLC